MKQKKRMRETPKIFSLLFTHHSAARSVIVLAKLMLAFSLLARIENLGDLLIQLIRKKEIRFAKNY